ncbi:hypothetical protein [Pseudomonas putida]|uniref:hypothetical protein n=1 Tax=Pseudomonas putida TaxID=303 RepID=UPI0023649EED|nr:hypothetical protein [Pseudomonas putida]MDD2005074.1 hypothetical protein [Pseudomonas putida]
MSQLYRIVWFLAMVLVMAPAFIFAANVEGISHVEASAVVLGYLQSMIHLPYAVALPLSPIVAFVGQLLPASSSLLVMLGEMLWQHLGVILTFVFFAFVSPPFIDKIDARFGQQAPARTQAQ